ncbi:MAG TPA: Rrf2 family transcriptional regulator [Polyangiaceae bacterium]|nr:Rrf2 family transcriptional regulator [Polyangiaceae bacterium]
MASSSRFALGTHVLVSLALRADEVVPSETLAASVNTNPAFLRQIIGQLREAGLVRSKLGTGGGSLLARPAASITLDEVYRATETRPVVALHHSEPHRTCLVGRNIVPVLEGVLARAEGALLEELRRVSIAELARQVCKRG